MGAAAVPIAIIGGAVMTSIASAIGTSSTNDTNKQIADENLDMQKEVFEYNKGVQAETWKREDTAYQRTVADMRAAGLSPLTMNGTNGAGEAVAVTAPQNQHQQMMSPLTAMAQSSSVADVLESVADVKSKSLDNEFAERTMEIRISKEEALAAAQAYESFDLATKHKYNKVFGIHSGMTPEERYWAIYSKSLGLSSTSSSESLDSFGRLYKADNLRDYTPGYARGFTLMRGADEILDHVLDMIPKLRGKSKSQKGTYMRQFQNYDWLPFQPMETLDIPVESLKEIDRSLNTLSRFFAKIVSECETKDKRSYTPRENLLAETYPWKAYIFDYGESHVRIHRHRSGHFSVECLGFILTTVKPFISSRRHSSDYRYQNYYGDFEKLSDCVKLFSEVCRNVLNDKLGVFF